MTLKAGWQQWLDCWPGLSAWWESPRYVPSESLHSFYPNCKQLHKAGLLTSIPGNRYRTGIDIHSSGTTSWVGSQLKIRVFSPETLSPEFRGQYLAADGTMPAAAGLWVNTVHGGELLSGDTGIQLVSLPWHVYFWLCPVYLSTLKPIPSSRTLSPCVLHTSLKYVILI